MSIAELKVRLADVPGIETLTMAPGLLMGRQTFGLNGVFVAVDPNATDQDIETAIRNAVRLPAVALNPAKPSEVKPMSVTGAKYAAGSFSSRLRGIREKIQANGSKMDAALADMEQAADAHSQLADTVQGEAAALQAELAQFTNGGE